MTRTQLAVHRGAWLVLLIAVIGILSVALVTRAHQHALLDSPSRVGGP